MSHRLPQVNALLQERVAAFLAANFEPPVGTLVTVTRVATSPDLRSATVYVSVLPDGRRGSILQDLRRLVGPLRRAVAEGFSHYTVPVLTFQIDDVEVRATAVEALIDSLRETSPPEEHD